VSIETRDVELVGDEVAVNVARATLFAAATAATAPMSVTHPIAPNIPITLQTLWVFLAGLFLGPLWGSVSFGLYLLAGAVGLPVFEGASGGIGVLFGQTGGYIFGFVLGAFLTGLVAHGLGEPKRPRDIELHRLVAAPVAGSVGIYALGVLGLVWFAGLPIDRAVAVGVVPFLPVAAVKIAASVLIGRNDAVVPR
jgi:biotin transport system substrate-specific component